MENNQSVRIKTKYLAYVVIVLLFSILYFSEFINNGLKLIVSEGYKIPSNSSIFFLKKLCPV